MRYARPTLFRIILVKQNWNIFSAIFEMHFCALKIWLNSKLSKLNKPNWIDRNFPFWTLRIRNYIFEMILHTWWNARVSVRCKFVTKIIFLMANECERVRWTLHEAQYTCAPSHKCNDKSFFFSRWLLFSWHLWSWRW